MAPPWNLFADLMACLQSAQCRTTRLVNFKRNHFAAIGGTGNRRTSTWTETLYTICWTSQLTQVCGTHVHVPGCQLSTLAHGDESEQLSRPANGSNIPDAGCWATIVLSAMAYAYQVQDSFHLPKLPISMLCTNTCRWMSHKHSTALSAHNRNGEGFSQPDKPDFPNARDTMRRILLAR